MFFLLFENHKIQVIIGSKVDPVFLVKSPYFHILTIIEICVERGKKMNKLRPCSSSHECWWSGLGV